MEGKRGQLALIVIVAIVIVAAVVIYFVSTSNVASSSVPAELAPVYNYYLSCIQEQAQQAIDIAGSQGGHIYVNSYSPASDYSPFSSQLNFLGLPIPYWYYITGNGLAKEQVPSKTDIQNDISRYISEGIGKCDFEQFYSQGFSISFTKPTVTTSISDGSVSVDVISNVNVTKGTSSAIKSEHKIAITSKLGKFYNIALQIYNKEKSDSFLENYSVDVLRLYAPVDGVEIGCSPKIWKTPDVISALKQGLVNNIAAIKFQSSSLLGGNASNKYFDVNLPVNENVNLLYSQSWPTKIDISGNGVDNSLMVADTVGTQPGLGVLGFCYAPYHFVYDISYPVLVQVYNDQEIFQFPVGVVISKNLPRQGIPSEIDGNQSVDLCAFKTQDVSVNVYDAQLKPVNAEISYGCFDQKCHLGKTVNGVFSGKAPACVNGYIYADADNYTEVKQIFSSNNESSANMVLDKEYNDLINVNVGGQPLDGQAIVLFTRQKTASATLPTTNNVQLSEGLYNISVYIYGNSSLTIPASTKTQCVQAAQSGIAGLFGATKEQCYDVTLPATNITYALIGGGQSEAYILESDLQKGNITLNVDKFKVPATLEDLQFNYESFDQSGVVVN